MLTIGNLKGISGTSMLFKGLFSLGIIDEFIDEINKQDYTCITNIKELKEYLLQEYDDEFLTGALVRDGISNSNFFGWMISVKGYSYWHMKNLILRRYFNEIFKMYIFTRFQKEGIDIITDALLKQNSLLDYLEEWTATHLPQESNPISVSDFRKLIIYKEGVNGTSVLRDFLVMGFSAPDLQRTNTRTFDDFIRWKKIESQVKLDVEILLFGDKKQER